MSLLWGLVASGFAFELIFKFGLDDGAFGLEGFEEGGFDLATREGVEVHFSLFVC